MLMGTVVMVVGVLIAKLTSHAEYEAVEIAGDLTGYLVHGVGAVPYVDAIVLAVRRSNESD
jgi:hypothetical protein